MKQDKNSGWAYKPALYRWIFLVLLTGMAVMYDYNEIGHLRPSGNHIWRQSDCLSLTLNYYNGSMNLFTPAIHNQQSDGFTSGYTAGEFPILYWGVALLWKIFGYHESLYKLLVVLIAFAGLYCFFRLMEDVLKDSVWALLYALLLFTSPIVAFYSNNYLTNIPALSMMLCGLWFFYRYMKRQRMASLWVSMAFFAMAGLLKVSALIALVVIVFVFITEALNIIRYRREGRIFPQPLKQLLPFLMVLAAMAAWYVYAAYYNHKHGGMYTFNNIWPIWEISRENIASIWHEFTVFLMYQLFGRYVLMATGLMFLFIVVMTCLRRIPWQVLMLLLLVYTGVCGYFLLWYQAFNVHDYYMIDILILFISTFFVFAVYLHRNFPKISRHPAFRAVFLVLLIYSFLYTRNNLEMRLRWKPERGDTYLCFVTPYENGIWWFNDDYNRRFIYPFHRIEAYNRSIGIKPDDKVYVPDDGSINISLALMDQPGWNGFGEPRLPPAYRIFKVRELGARYLFISNPDLYKEDYLKPYLKNKIGTFEGVDIYDMANL